MIFLYLILLLFCFLSKRAQATELWCYSCVSHQPGCGELTVDWRIHHAITCPRDDDTCVKITETKGAEKLITRDCLSNLVGLRRDIPADTYEGCRPAAEHPKLAVYVQNNIKELEIKRDYWNEVTYCFCKFDQWCNGSHYNIAEFANVLITLISLVILQKWMFH
ncbi:QVR superfamily protein crim [Tachypleus tridentatus]|uniref:QVR superfamily protein crim n=1 Tax=Tachypleus tridentatus TaxID=6853 RepID=UPI003FD2AA9D